MRRILLIFKNDFKRRMKSPGTILVMMLIPILMTAIIGMIFSPGGGENKMPKIKVLVVDNDKNAVSKMVLGALDSKDMKEMFNITLVDDKTGREMIKRGKASALIIIPEKFTDRVLNAENTELTVIKNPSEQFLPRVVEEFVGTLAVGMSAIIQVFEDEVKAIKLLAETPLEQVTAAAMVPYIEKSREKILSLKNYLDPLLIKLKTTVDEKKKKEKKPAINVYAFMLPGTAIMFILFIIEIFMRDILAEREEGKLQRMMFSPIRPFEFVLARIVSGWLMGILVSIVIVVFGMVVFDIAWGNYLYLFLVVAITCFWIASFFALMNAIFKNRKQAGAVVAPVILVFSAFGGSMFQVDQLPGFMQKIANFTLNHWFIQGCHQIRDGLFPSLPIVIILTSGVLLFAMATALLQKRVSA